MRMAGILYHVKEGCAYLMYLAKLFDYFFVSSQGTMGAIALDKDEDHERTMGHPVSFRHQKCM